MNRRIKAISPLGFQTLYDYDPVGNVISKEDANGNTTLYEYDALDRLKLTAYPNGGKVKRAYDAVGNLIQISNIGIGLNDVTQFSYDELDRLTEVTRDYGSFSKSINYTYDENGNLATMRDSDGGITTYQCDEIDRLVDITDPHGEVTRYQYDKGGRRIAMQRPNGVTTAYSYDAANRLLSLVNEKSSGNVISSYAYTYDNVGNRLSMTEADGNVTSYGYDALNRLVNVTYPSGEFTQYAYDAVGNRLSKQNSTSTVLYTYDADNRLLAANGVSYIYDDNGNLVSKSDGTNYEYDYENRLIKVTLPDASQVTYRYSANGDRLSRTNSSGTTYYLYDLEDILMELDAGGVQQARYTHGPGIDEPISMRRNGNTSYYQFDGLGSLTSLTDINENVVVTYKYEAFGTIREETGTVINPYKFTSREYDDDSGLYYYRARYYYPELGRFLSKDPLGLFYADNLYVYVKNNPIKYTDPSGNFYGKGMVENAIAIGGGLLMGIAGVSIAGGTGVTVIGGLVGAGLVVGGIVMIGTGVAGFIFCAVAPEEKGRELMQTYPTITKASATGIGLIIGIIAGFMGDREDVLEGMEVGNIIFDIVEYFVNPPKGLEKLLKVSDFLKDILWLERNNQLGTDTTSIGDWPHFSIAVIPEKAEYNRGETVSVTISVRNKAEQETIWLGVSFKDPTGESAKYDPEIRITPQSAIIDHDETKTFTAEWTVPEDAPAGVYKIAVNCWRDNTFTDWYSDDLEWASIFNVPTEAGMGETFTNTIGMEFVWISAGEFDMGSPSDEEGHYADEEPVHHVTIGNSFYMGKYEVTQQQWRVIMGDNPSYFTGDDDLPVEKVSWDDVQDFITKLNEKEGTDKYRLPSEAEWECTCRAGTTTRYSFGDDESELGDYAWYWDNSGSQTHPVGQKKANPWGLYDMHGNVWEWVQDCWHRDYNGAPADGSAWVVSCSCAYRVNRVGSWSDRALICRSADRAHGGPRFRSSNLGFRLLQEV